jgi:hypothetical protein
MCGHVPPLMVPDLRKLTFANLPNVISLKGQQNDPGTTKPTLGYQTQLCTVFMKVWKSATCFDL